MCAFNLILFTWFRLQRNVYSVPKIDRDIDHHHHQLVEVTKPKFKDFPHTTKDCNNNSGTPGFTFRFPEINEAKKIREVVNYDQPMEFIQIPQHIALHHPQQQTQAIDRVVDKLPVSFSSDNDICIGFLPDCNSREELVPECNNDKKSDDSGDFYDNNDKTVHMESSLSDSDSDSAKKLETLWEHQELIEQLKMELRKVRATGLPTILEESESPRLTEESLKPWKIEEDLQYVDCMDEVKKNYKSYMESMRKFDILNYQKMYAMGRYND